MRVVAFFNNKGGVGKTTLAANLAAHLALRRNQRVLFADCDPQCNSTQLILGEERVPDFYSETAPAESTLSYVVQPIQDGDSHIRPTVTVQSGPSNRFGVSIIPGNPRLSMIEDKLSEAWLQRSTIAGLRRLNWFHHLCAGREDQFDFIFADLGPSLGSLNRSVLLGSDYFVTPMGADIFSVYGVRNIGDWLRKWTVDYEKAASDFKSEDLAAFTQYKIMEHTKIRKGYLGYTLQQYIAKKTKEGQRPTKAFDQVLGKIPDAIQSHLGSYFAPGVSIQTARLGVLPYMYSLIPLSQTAASPIMELSADDGLIGSQFRQADDYAAIIDSLAQELMTRATKGGVQ